MCVCVKKLKMRNISCLYVRERVEMIERVKSECELEYIERLDEDSQLNILIGIGWRKQSKQIREIVLEYIRKAYDIRKRYIA